MTKAAELKSQIRASVAELVSTGLSAKAIYKRQGVREDLRGVELPDLKKLNGALLDERVVRETVLAVRQEKNRLRIAERRAEERAKEAKASLTTPKDEEYELCEPFRLDNQEELKARLIVIAVGVLVFLLATYLWTLS